MSWKQHKSKSCCGNVCWEHCCCVFFLQGAVQVEHTALCVSQYLLNELHALTFKGLLTSPKTAQRTTQLSHFKLNKQMIAHIPLPFGISKQLPHPPLFGAVLHPCTNLAAHKLIQEAKIGSSWAEANHAAKGPGRADTPILLFLLGHTLCHTSKLMKHTREGDVDGKDFN